MLTALYSVRHLSAQEWIANHSTDPHSGSRPAVAQEDPCVHVVAKVSARLRIICQVLHQGPLLQPAEHGAASSPCRGFCSRGGARCERSVRLLGSGLRRSDLARLQLGYFCSLAHGRLARGHAFRLLKCPRPSAWQQGAQGQRPAPVDARSRDHVHGTCACRERRRDQRRRQHVGLPALRGGEWQTTTCTCLCASERLLVSPPSCSLLSLPPLQSLTTPPPNPHPPPPQAPFSPLSRSSRSLSLLSSHPHHHTVARSLAHLAAAATRNQSWCATASADTTQHHACNARRSLRAAGLPQLGVAPPPPLSMTWSK